MLGVGFVLLFFFVAFRQLVRGRLYSGYVYLAMLLCMTVPSLLMCKSAISPWMDNIPVSLPLVALLASLLCASMIPWVITDSAFCGVGQKFSVSTRYIPSIKTTFFILIFISLYSIFYLAPYAYKGIVTDALIMRKDVWISSPLPDSIFTTLACGGALCFIFCIPAFFIAFLDESLKPFRWWLLFSSLSYPVNCMVYASRAGAVIYVAFLITFLLIFLPMYTKRVRRFVAGSASIVGIALVGLALCISSQRFSENKNPNVDYWGGTIGYAAQQPYVFSSLVQDEKEFLGFNICFPLISETLDLQERPKSDLNWNYEHMFPTMFGQFYMIGGWWSLILFSLIYIGYYSLAAYWLYRRQRFSALLLLFIVYLYTQLSGFFYYQVGYSAAANIFYLICSIVPLFAPEALIKLPRRTGEIRLVEINTAATGCSTGKITSTLTAMAAQKGWKTVIAFGRNADPDFSNIDPIHRPVIWHIGNRFSHYLHGLASRLFDAHGLASRNDTILLCRKIAEFKPDIVHLHNLHGYYLNYKILFRELRRLDIPVVYTLHDCWQITGHCPHFTNFQCSGWETKCDVTVCKGVHQYPASLFIQRHKANYASKLKAISSMKNLTFVCVSDWLNDVLGRSELAHFPRLTIHNGIDTSIYRPLSKKEYFPLLPDSIKNIQDDCKLVVAAASPWTKAKGFDKLKIAAENLPPNTKLAVIGLKNSQRKELLLSSPEIITTPHIDSPLQITAVLNRANLFFNPTLADSLPTINLEALACGTPVATSDIGGAPETIDSSCGVIFNPLSDKEITTAIRDVLKDNINFADNCRNFVLDNFNAPIQFEQYFSLFHNILDDRNS